MNPTKRIQALLSEARKLAIAHVEASARKILQDHPNLDEFVMGMGTCFFNEGKENLGPEQRAYMRPLSDFIDDWDETLHMTGIPMRFTANGPKITDW